MPHLKGYISGKPVPDCTIDRGGATSEVHVMVNNKLSGYFGRGLVPYGKNGGDGNKAPNNSHRFMGSFEVSVIP